MGEILSADSRQVYSGMDIGTGKDLPVNSKLETDNSKLGKQGMGYYEVSGVKIWGYDLVSPNDEFSVSQYVLLAAKILRDVWERNKLPILVGGSGLYIKGLIDGIPSADVPKNFNLRKSYSGKSVEELFEVLCTLDPIKGASLNISDKRNSRRLIRAIEIADYKLRKGTAFVNRIKSKNLYNTLFVGLYAPKHFLDKRIEKRVHERLEMGFKKEIKGLLKRGVKFNFQSMDSMGYRHWMEVISKKSTKSKAIADWIRDERRYAKRQMTWFKKDKRIFWFDISRKDWQKSMEILVRKWYIKE